MGLYHSQNVEALFFHTPGLLVVTPSTPYEAKGLLKSAIRDDNPVIFLEHKKTYRLVRGEVPDGEYTLPIGPADVKRAGSDVTVVSYGLAMHYCLAAAEAVAGDGISAEVVDLRTLKPLDTETILESVRKTGKLLIVHEDNISGGIGAEIAALAADEAFEYLDAPSPGSAARTCPPCPSPNRWKTPTCPARKRLPPNCAGWRRTSRMPPFAGMTGFVNTLWRTEDCLVAQLIELPHVGESVVEGTIGKWLKQPGDRVERYDPLVEVVTDKVTMEVPSPVAGELLRIIAQEGETVPMGAPIAEVDADGGGGSEPAAAPAQSQASVAAAPPARPQPQPSAPTPTPTSYLITDARPVGPTGGSAVEAQSQEEAVAEPAPAVSTPPTPATTVAMAPAQTEERAPNRLSPAVRRLARSITWTWAASPAPAWAGA